VPQDPAAWVRPVAPGTGLPLQVRATTDVRLADWARTHSGIVDGWLARHGAVRFDGFAVTRGDFRDVAVALAGVPQPYRERSSPRTEVADGVYSSTDHPADQSIPLHNENSYQASFPARLVFGCLREPASRGGTPLADCRRVLERLPAGVVDAFRERHVRYVRTYGGGTGIPWREAIGPDRASVEKYCRDGGLTCEWLAGDRLQTTSVRPAVAVHPVTGESVWFNHAAFFHVSTIEPRLRAALLEQYAEDELPANTYYGDGGPIEPDVLDAIRAAYAAESRCLGWRRGDVMVVDNLLVAHGREPFTGDREVVVSMGGSIAHQPVPS
jgi:alpha-ketoglutarate-dependent taurine dioxygenase